MIRDGLDRKETIEGVHFGSDGIMTVQDIVPTNKRISILLLQLSVCGVP